MIQETVCLSGHTAPHLSGDREIQTFITVKTIIEPAEMTKHGLKLLLPLAVIKLSHEISFLGRTIKKMWPNEIWVTGWRETVGFFITVPYAPFYGTCSSVIPQAFILCLGWACLCLVPGTTAGNMSACGCSVPTCENTYPADHRFPYIYIYLFNKIAQLVKWNMLCISIINLYLIFSPLACISCYFSRQHQAYIITN